MNIHLRLATREERPLLAAMLPNYLRELAADTDYPHLARYWHENGRYPYLIVNQAQPVGFALVRTLLPATTMEMAEFYVAKPWRKYGIGKSAVQALFALHPGRWQLSVVPPTAYRAWVEKPGIRPHWALSFSVGSAP
ncbi:GNAT family N-acetyltransferase [Serratia liquefaciens]